MHDRETSIVTGVKEWIRSPDGAFTEQSRGFGSVNVRRRHRSTEKEARQLPGARGVTRQSRVPSAEYRST